MVIWQVLLFFFLAKIAFAEQTVLLELSSKGNDISFDKEKVEVRFEKSIKINFRNKAEASSHIQHNIAILKPDSTTALIADLQKSNYDLEAMKKHRSILILSKSLNPGEEETIVFKPEAPGQYPYLCLMPGHSDILGMKGMLVVTAP